MVELFVEAARADADDLQAVRLRRVTAMLRNPSVSLSTVLAALRLIMGLGWSPTGERQAQIEALIRGGHGG